MKRKLFCEISPLTFRISVQKNRLQRIGKDIVSGTAFAMVKQEEKLPVLINKHKSLIRRKLGNVDMTLQENKAINLGLAAPKITNVLIRPGETFSFWKLVGPTKAKYGYKEGLQISNGKTTAGIGGGMCQFTNLIHWMVLHTPLQIVEHHHHDRFDLFPDFNRQVPFGVGTSVFYNYIDYRFYNPTDITFQLIVMTTEEYLCGELRADKEPEYAYHIKTEGEGFVRESGQVYRLGEVYRETIDRKTGNPVERKLIRTNHALVMYDTGNLSIKEQ